MHARHGCWLSWILVELSIGVVGNLRILLNFEYNLVSLREGETLLVYKIR